MSDPRDAAPQPPPVPKTICGHCQMEICRGETTRHYGFYSAHEESRCRDLLKFRIAALEAQLAEAQSGETLQTVTGALVHKRDRYIRQLEEKIARQREDLRKEKGLRDEVQEQLAMAVEALRDAQKWATRWAQTTEHRDPNANDYGPYNQHPRGYAICPIPDWEVKQKRDDYAYALAATAASVTQHTAEVERRGAAKALDKLLSTLSPDGLPWKPKYPYELHHAVENLKRAAELEGA